MDNYMTLEDAIEIVLRLARENCLDDSDELELQTIAWHQRIACNVVEDFFVNVAFKDENITEKITIRVIQPGNPGFSHGIIECSKHGRSNVVDGLEKRCLQCEKEK